MLKSVLKQAILGTPNGGGLAWFLVQHREQLGHKRIKSVVAFDNALTDAQRASGKANQYSFPSLAFEIGAADPFDDSSEIPDDEDSNDGDPFGDSNEIPPEDER